ncbi:hypothetical protein H9P43_003237 [Blastocladiella emersonii ATCC 22665]|nr:hypothetical protein H9P43_003237 [Blastocladiella emersonii ATCC 22665]
MDFSDAFRQTNGQCYFSADGAYQATVVGHKLVIRDAETLSIVNVITAVDAISYIEFSPDAKYILCASYELGAVQVWELDGTEPVAKTDEGLSGCVRVAWDQYSARAVLTWSAFGLRISVWNLVDGSLTYIRQPKYADRGFAFREDHRYLAVLDRVDCRDEVCVYDCATWDLVKHFAVESTDATDLAWSPDGRHIAVWDSVLEYRVLIYSPDGRRMHSYSAYENGLGVRLAVWSPTSQFLAVGSYDQKLRLLNHFTFNAIAEWGHAGSVTLTPKSKLVVFREPSLLASGAAPAWPTAVDVAHPRLRYEAVMPSQSNITLNFPVVKLDAEKPAKKVGVSMVKWSIDGRYLAVKNENTPTLVYIYSMAHLRLISILQHGESVKAMEWMQQERSRHVLTLCTGTGALHFWDGGRTVVPGHPDEVLPFTDADAAATQETYGVAESVIVPVSGFHVHNFRWAGGRDGGKRVLLIDKDKFCVAFDVQMHDQDAFPTR